jgi:hypothetical protein
MTRGQTIAIGIGALASLSLIAVVSAKGGGTTPKKPKTPAKPTGPDDPGFDPAGPGEYDPDAPVGPGGTEPGGGGGSGPSNGPTRRVPSTGALVFGNLTNGGIPGDFDGAANDVRFSADCSVVLVGRQFWSMGTLDLGTYGQNAEYESCVEHASIRACITAGQNACCFIDYQMNQKNVTSAKAIGRALLAGLKPPCIAQPEAQWPPAMKAFVAWLKGKVNQYVQESSGQADW